MKNKLLWGILSIGIMIPCIVGASSPNGRVQGHPVSSSQYLQNTCNGDAIENFTCDYTGDPVVLRMGYGVDFYDTFYAGNQDRRLRGFCAGIIEPENNGDYNNGDNPGFVRTGGINTVLGRKVPANTGITIIQTAREYQIRKHPLQRSSNNLMVKYVVEYANNSADNATRYQHTECYPYIISRCGDGVVDEDWDGKTADKPAEQCDPEAPEWKNRPDGKICNSSCEIEYATPKCSSTYNGISKYTSSSSPWLSGTENLCEVGNPVGFSYSGAPRIFTWNCKNGSTTTSSPCVAQQQWCGDGIKNGGETCDFEDTTNKDGRGNGGCSNQCKPIVVEDPICSSSYNGQRLLSLTAGVHLCTKGTYTGFSYSESNHKWTWKCNNILGTSVDCLAIKQYCGDGIKDAGEECDDGDKNGTNTSACSATCTNVGSATCGSLGGGNTYFPGGKQSNPWLTKTSPGMCSNGAIVGEPYITGTDSHIEWTCSNLNGTSIYCKAYQQYCGDGKINGGEECDGGELCSSSCKSVNPSIACNQNFTGKLRLGYNEPFTDTLNAGGRDQYLYYKEVLFKENHGDYNNGSNPEFNWTSELVRNGMKVGAHSSMIILESNPYHIVSAPSKRAQNNIYIEYTIWYDYVKHSATPPKADLYPHKECAEYAISRCGDGIVDKDYGEVCDPEAPEWKNRQDGQVCNAECKKETSKRGDFVVEKTLLSDRYITKTGQELEWKIKVTASGGYVENVVIKDDLPPVLSYVTSSSNLTPSNSVQMKPNQPTITSGGKHLEWETTGILESGNSIVLSVITKVDMMPDKDGYENVACAWAEGLNEKCDHEPIPTKGDPDLRIKKTFTDGTKEKTVKVGDEIAYRIDFGNRGKAPATITSIKDFLPKNVQYITGSIYIDRASTHSNSTQTGDMELMEGLKIVDGVRIEIYGGMTVKPGDVGHIIITGVVKGDFTDNRTNFACIYLNDELIGCDDVTHHIGGEVLCKSNIEKNKSNDLCNGNSWTVPVKCNSDGGTADKIEILCDGSVQKSGTNISELEGSCTFLSDGDHTVQCKVNGSLKAVSGSNCEGTYTLSHHNCSSCFPAGTKVKMADGTSKDIEKVKAGDAVLSYNTNTNTNESSVVKQTIVHEDNIHEMYELTINENVLKVTDVHPFYVKKSASSKDYAWIEAKDLKVGDILLMSDGSLVKIEKINHYNNQETVYNLEVENNHDYFVDKGYLVHNKGGSTCFIAGTKVTMVDGSKKNIEDVKIGEKVLGSNGSVNTVLGYDRPILANRHLWSINGSEYFVSDEHPFMTTEGWKSFNPEMTKLEVDLDTTELKIGDILVTDSGLEEIKAVDYINADYDTPLFNLMLDGDHTYYANDYLVHNKCTNCDPVPHHTDYCDEHPDNEICALANPHCFNVNEGNFSIELGEYLPFYFNVYRNREDTEHKYKYVTDDNDVCNVGDVDLSSLKCRYVIRKPATTDDRIRGIDVVYRSSPFQCLSLNDDSRTRNANMIQKWVETQRNVYEIDVDDYETNYWPEIKTTNSRDWDIQDNNGDNVLGEYQFQIEVFEYRQCMNDGVWKDQPIKKIPGENIGVCQSNFVLTEPYTVQKTPSGNLTASTKTLGKFKQVDGNAITPFSSYLNAIATSNYEPNDKVDERLKNFIDKYEKLAVQVNLQGKNVKKVPGKSIYFISGDETINGSNFSTPFTFVQTSPRGTITISGNSNLNMMVLSLGKIAFKGDCTTNQNVKGIFYAKGGLSRLGVFKNTELSRDVWCTKGGLNIKGVLIGTNFNSLMNGSRSHLDTWFKRDGSRSTSDTQELKTKVMNGASVVIEYSPSIFSKSTMPPGAEDFTTALSIYKQ